MAAGVLARAEPKALLDDALATRGTGELVLLEESVTFYKVAE